MAQDPKKLRLAPCCDGITRFLGLAIWSMHASAWIAVKLTRSFPSWPCCTGETVSHEWTCAGYVKVKGV